MLLRSSDHLHQFKRSIHMNIWSEVGSSSFLWEVKSMKSWAYVYRMNYKSPPLSSLDARFRTHPCEWKTKKEKKKCHYKAQTYTRFGSEHFRPTSSPLFRTLLFLVRLLLDKSWYRIGNVFIYSRYPWSLFNVF